MKISVVGSYGVGMTMYVDRIPTAGETLTGGRLSTGPGGKGSNQAVAAARLGADVSLFTAVGSDTFGDDARALWSAEGVDHQHVLAANAPTMAGFILVEPNGENRIVIAPGALDELTPTDLDAFRPELETADVVVVSLEIPPTTAVEALRIAHRAGTTTLLNPAPAQSLPPEAWQWIDILTPNLTEAHALTGGNPEDPAPSPDHVIDALRRSYDGAIVLTLGSRGAVVDDNESRVRVNPVIPRNVVDTTGAGDSFTAALATAYGRGERLEDAARYAAAAGAWTVGIAEVIPALPRPSDLESLLSEDNT